MKYKTQKILQIENSLQLQKRINHPERREISVFHSPLYPVIPSG